MGGHHEVGESFKSAHGLGEHMGRYAELAETLVEGDLSFTEMITEVMA